jgi:tripartite-type tricarboxylate transporter receptor subunit TctC
MVITSSKYKSWSEVPKNKKLNLGTTGLGVTSHLIALQITEQYPNIQLVPFKSPSDIMSAILSDSIDFGVGFISESEAWSTNNQHKKLHILGTTGNVQVKNYPLLYKQGFPNVLKDLNNPQHLVVSSSTDDEKFHEWRLILSQAERSQGVRQFYNIDNCIPLSNNNLKINQWFDGQATRWKSLTTNINLNK